VLQLERGLRWLRLRPQAAFFAAGASVALLLLIYSGVPAAVAAVAAWIALIRHFAQTDADRQRRITESFSKAVEQLGSDRLEVRLGGIYSLERISKESPEDYWTVMENLTAFVRERSRRNEAERLQHSEQRVSRRAYFRWLEAGQPDGRTAEFWAEAVEEDEREPPATDIVAVLTVIKRRSERSREREVNEGWRLDLSGAVLRGVDLLNAHLERTQPAPPDPGAVTAPATTPGPPAGEARKFSVQPPPRLQNFQKKFRYAPRSINASASTPMPRLVSSASNSHFDFCGFAVGSERRVSGTGGRHGGMGGGFAKARVSSKSSQDGKMR